jgi:hypothetical protein
MRTKITDYQSRLRELERQKTELENADIVALVRGIDIPPDAFAAFLASYRERREYTPAVTPETGKTVIDAEIEKEDTVIEN